MTFQVCSAKALFCLLLGTCVKVCYGKTPFMEGWLEGEKLIWMNLCLFLIGRFVDILQHCLQAYCRGLCKYWKFLQNPWKTFMVCWFLPKLPQSGLNSWRISIIYGMQILSLFVKLAPFSSWANTGKRGNFMNFPIVMARFYSIFLADST